MKDFFKILAFFLKNYRKETLLTVGLIVLAGVAEAFGVAAFLPFFQLILEGEATLNHIPDGKFRDFMTASGIELNFITVGLFIITAISLKAGILYVALRKVGRTVARISADLRRRLLHALLNAKWGFFVHHTLGVSLNAIIMETFRASTAFVSMARFISAMVQFSIYAIGAFLLSWQIFLGALVIGSALVFALWGLVRIARAAGQSQIDLSKQMLSYMAEMLQGIKALRAMALEDKFLNLLSKHSKGLEKSQADQQISAQSMRVLHEPLMVLTVVIGLYGIVTYSALSSSEIALMGIIFIRLLNSMNIAQTEYQRLVTQEAALWSLMDTIGQTEDATEDWGGTAHPPKQIETVTFENIHFSHDDQKILSGLNLEVKPKKLTALIGESGSGKTTILDVLSGFYEVESGALKINDQPIGALDLKKWRSVLGFVPQEVFLFNDSVAENIRMGHENLSDQDIWHALEAAGAKEFVEALDGGLNAPVGEGGRKLSGGQRQRIAIARAIVHKPQILLLDEATSALDSKTEKILLETLQNLAKTITVIFISHNKIVQDYADHVYRIEDGQAMKIEDI